MPDNNANERIKETSNVLNKTLISEQNETSLPNMETQTDFGVLCLPNVWIASTRVIAHDTSHLHSATNISNPKSSDYVTIGKG